MKDRYTLEIIKETIYKGKEFSFHALGSSMFPSIRNGDLITIEPVKLDSLMLGDVIFFEVDHKLFAHRLIKKNEVNSKIYFITKGDFLVYSDNPIESTQILGKVTKVKRKGKEVKYQNRSQQRIIYVLAIFYHLFYLLMTNFYQIIQKIDLILNKAFFHRHLKHKLYRNHQNIQIMKASQKDLPLVAKYYSTPLNEILNQDNANTYILAKNKNRIVGALMVSSGWQTLFNDNNLWIMGLEVDSKYRGRHVGQDLIFKTIQELKKDAISEIFVNVFESNDAAINLYKKCGFKFFNCPEKIAKINKYYDRIAPDSGKSLILSRNIS